MKSEKGFIHLLIFCEVIVLVFVVVFGAVKLLKEPEEENQAEGYVGVDSNVQNMVWQQEAGEPEAQEGTETQMQETEYPMIPVEEFSLEVQEILADMTLEEKMAQLFLVSPETLTNNDVVTIAGEGTKNALESYPVGGLLYARRNFLASGQMRQMVTNAQQYSLEAGGLHLFVAAMAYYDEKEVAVISATNDAEPLLQFIQVSGNVEEVGTDVIELPLLKEQEQITEALNIAGLRCYVIEEGIVQENAAEHAVEALKNGADMLLVTEGFENIYAAVLEAVNVGELNGERIEQAAGRIITEKLNMTSVE